MDREDLQLRHMIAAETVTESSDINIEVALDHILISQICKHKYSIANICMCTILYSHLKFDSPVRSGLQFD